jgi:hypothetical protein
MLIFDGVQKFGQHQSDNQYFQKYIFLIIEHKGALNKIEYWKGKTKYHHVH